MTDRISEQAVGFPIWTKLSTSVVALSLLLVLLSVLAYAFYNAYLHPLRRYPGPVLWRSFRFPYVIATHRGELHKRFTEFHTKYGPIVRVCPNQLSYADGRAWKDIYSNRPGHLPFERNRTSFKKMSPDEPNSIIGFDEDDHARFRRAFANGFSEKSLKEQAPVVESYIDLFMTQLKAPVGGRAWKEKTVDFSVWFNYLTFDIAGDLTYGESFNCVKNGEAHPWVDIAQDFGKGLALIASINQYPPIDKLLRYIIPKRIMQRTIDHRAMSYEQAQKRITMDIERPDWVTPTKKYTDQKGDPMTDREWGVNLLVIAFAGSETGATALTGILRMLVQHKGVLHRLTQELRSTFKQEEDINVASTSNLPFLNAVIDEGMRLCPPVAIAIPRIAPKGGDTVCGQWVPEDTYVAVNQYSANRQSYNFHNPNSFLPERFLHPDPAVDDMAVFQPFQLGRHNCIGMRVAFMELRLTLSRLLWAFDVELADAGDRWDWGDQCTFALWDKRPLNVVLRHAGGE